MSLEAAIACTRFGLGARKGEIETAANAPRDWLRSQLSETAYAAFPSAALKSSDQLLTELLEARAERQRAKRSGKDEQDAGAEIRQRVRTALRSEITARSQFGANTSAPFHERLVRFWSNHFTVTAKNPLTTIIAGAYEREAIRANALGSFYDLARGAIFHAGMLVYLDNWQSIGPRSRLGERRDLGLNENLAREVLELHTVTPKAGYSQDDVEEFAKALTGWTIGHPRRSTSHHGKPLFNARGHEPGPRQVLGKRYKDTGAAQAERIVRDLCRHPATARNVAFKLARHFHSDTPPTALVDRLSQVFIDTDGDLKALYTAVIDAPEMWEPEAHKIKTPDELLTSTSRLLSVNAVLTNRPRDVFTSLAQQPFGASSPQGWPDEAAHWIGADSLNKRIEWANRVAQRAAHIDGRIFLQNALGDRLSPQTLQSVSRAESPSQALALAIMSPDFQRR